MKYFRGVYCQACAIFFCLAWAANKAEGSLPDASTDGIEAVKKWAAERVSLGEKLFNTSGFRRTPSPRHWETKVTYEVLMDRFNNGNLTNDAYNVPPQQAQKQHTKT